MENMENINNRNKEGKAKTSKYWQDWKKSIPNMCYELRQVTLGMILGDAGMHKVGKEAYIKFEQSAQQKEFIDDLFKKYKLYTFMETPGIRIKKEEIKSYWFKTYSHKTFTELYNLFYLSRTSFSDNKKKTVIPGLITKEIDEIAFAYWIMCDGSLQKDKQSLILHTQNFDLITNDMICKELNEKFNLHSKTLVHKKQYYVIFIPSKDRYKVRQLIKNHMLNIFKYKIPISKKDDDIV